MLKLREYVWRYADSTAAQKYAIRVNFEAETNATTEVAEK